MLIGLAILTAILAVWAIRDEIRDAGRSDVEHVGQDGEHVTLPVPEGWTTDAVLDTLSEIEQLPVCAEIEAA